MKLKSGLILLNCFLPIGIGSIFVMIIHINPMGSNPFHLNVSHTVVPAPAPDGEFTVTLGSV